MSARRALVTGAGGFVGSAIAAGLARLGHDVIALDQSFDEAARAALSGTRLVEAELGRGVSLPRADVVIHAAALTSDPAAMGLSAAGHIRGNIDPLLAVLEALAAAPPRAFVFLSSSGVFAPQDGRPDLDDGAVPTATSPYAAAKRAGEAIVPAAMAGLSAAHVVRLGHVYGEGERPRRTRNRLSPVGRWLAAVRAGHAPQIGAGDPRRDWTWAGDIGPALARIAAGPSAGRPIHLASPHIRRDSAMIALIVPGRAPREADSGDASETKPPMIASRLPSLEGFHWTAPETALPALAARPEAAA